MLIRPTKETVWAWFGGRDPIHGDEIIRTACEQWLPSAIAAFGEPGKGVAGFNVTTLKTTTSGGISNCGVSNGSHSNGSFAGSSKLLGF